MKNLTEKNKKVLATNTDKTLNNLKEKKQNNKLQKTDSKTSITNKKKAVTLSKKNDYDKKSNSKNEILQNTTEEDLIDPAALARGDEPMTIVDHLDELRSRLIIIIASFFIITCISFYFSDILVHYINKPFLDTGNQLNIFTLVGGFMIKIKVSAAIAVILLIPLITFHIWRFISPAIDRPERFFSRMTIFSAVILFYLGVLFVFMILPSMIKVLLSFINNSMLNTIGADDYLHFIFFMSVIMGFLCELPIIMLILTRIGLVTPQFLIRKRKYALIIIWITAAVVTPGPDILSQSLVGIPLMFLYEISIGISKLALIRKKRKELKLKYNE